MQKHEVCTDCYQYAVAMVYNDFSGWEYEKDFALPEVKAQMDKVEAAMNELVPTTETILTPEDRCSEFSRKICDVCETRLAGERYELYTFKLKERNQHEKV